MSETVHYRGKVEIELKEYNYLRDFYENVNKSNYVVDYIFMHKFEKRKVSYLTETEILKEYKSLIEELKNENAILREYTNDIAQSFKKLSFWNIIRFYFSKSTSF